MVMEPVFTDVLQVAVVVRNLDEAVRRYADGYGIGPWSMYTFRRSQTNMTIRDQLVKYSFRLAVCDIGKVNWELVEPLDDVGSFAEFLQRHGEGVHHVCFATSDPDHATAHIRQGSPNGIGVVQGATIGTESQGFQYSILDSKDDLGVLCEVWKTSSGFEIPPPDEVYPSPAG